MTDNEKIERLKRMGIHPPVCPYCEVKLADITAKRANLNDEIHRNVDIFEHWDVEGTCPKCAKIWHFTFDLDENLRSWAKLGTDHLQWIKNKLGLGGTER